MLLQNFQIEHWKLSLIDVQQEGDNSRNCTGKKYVTLLPSNMDVRSYLQY